jgi:hypothetical protein
MPANVNRIRYQICPRYPHFRDEFVDFASHPFQTADGAENAAIHGRDHGYAFAFVAAVPHLDKSEPDGMIPCSIQSAHTETRPSTGDQ